MKVTYPFVVHHEVVTCRLASGKCIQLPVIPGILKHPHPDQLRTLLAKPGVAEKYTKEALRKAAWPILRQFPREWLRQCLDQVALKPSRHEAIAFLLA
jgi:hypothetical protein